MVPRVCVCQKSSICLDGTKGVCVPEVLYMFRWYQGCVCARSPLYVRSTTAGGSCYTLPCNKIILGLLPILLYDGKQHWTILNTDICVRKCILTIVVRIITTYGND